MFETDEFKHWAAENVVLLELDYPRTGGGASAELKDLARKYKIRGYPTIIFVNEEGSVIGRSGYAPGGPGNWLRLAKVALSNKTPTPVAGLSTGSETPIPPGSEGSLPGTELTWLTSYKDALAESKKTGKPVLADFTGKKWCGYCIKLRKEVFETADFRRWATDNVVLLELDYPRTGGGPSQELKDLARKYKVRGYPTIIFMNAEGARIGQTGYAPGGPQNWLRLAKSALSGKKPTRAGGTGIASAGSAGQAPSTSAGSAENAVIQLVVNLKNNQLKELAQFISSDATGLLKSLRSGRPSISELRRAKSLLGKVKPSQQKSTELPNDERRYVLINQRGTTLTFRCVKVDGKFVIRSMKSKSGRR